MVNTAQTTFAVADEPDMEHGCPFLCGMEGDAWLDAGLPCRLQISSIGDESIEVIFVSPTDKVEGSIEEEIELLNATHIITHIRHDIEGVNNILICLASYMRSDT